MSDGSGQTGSLVAQAAERWRADLFDVGGRNTLLCFRDLEIGTLDLAGTDPKALDVLFLGRTLKVARLFLGDIDAAGKRARSLRKRTVEFEEESVHVGTLIGARG